MKKNGHKKGGKTNAPFDSLKSSQWDLFKRSDSVVKATTSDELPQKRIGWYISIINRFKMVEKFEQTVSSRIGVTFLWYFY